MKIQTTTLMLAAGLLALLNLPAAAQEKPSSPPPPESGRLPDEPYHPEGQRAPRQAEEKPTAYLGVLTQNVSPELRTQFGLSDGFGLAVIEIMPDSPAKEAGLKEHDVLVTFEDQKLVNMEQLQALVRAKKKGDAVILNIISGGQQKQITVTIGERMVAVNQERPRGFMPPFPGMRDGEWGGNMQPWRDSADEFQRRMREYQERVQEWSRNGHRGPSPQPPMFDGPGRRDGEANPRKGGEGRPAEKPDMPRGESHSFSRSESHQSANITRSDDSGIYRLRRDDGRQTFSVKPKDSEEKSWPVNNEEQRAAVPEQYRNKLREMEEISSNIPRKEGGS